MSKEKVVKEIVFETQFNNSKTNISSNSGSRYLDLFHFEYNDKGEKFLVPYDKKDVYAEIQTYAHDNDIYVLLKKYLGGDLTALDKNKGFYADITNVPNNINDWHNRIEQGKDIFNGLPIEFKEMFGNDVNQFMTSIAEGSFENKLKDYKDSLSKAKEPITQNVGKTESEVKENEQK